MSDASENLADSEEAHEEILAKVDETLQQLNSEPLGKHDEPITSPLPQISEPVKLSDLGFTATDDSGLGDVVDDFDKAVSLKADENMGQSPYEELQRIQSVPSHLSAGENHSSCNLNAPDRTIQS